MTATALSQPLPGGAILSIGYPAFQSPLATIQTVITGGTLYSALACSALTQSIATGVPLVISGCRWRQSTQLVVTTTAAVAANATSIPVQPFTSPATFSSFPTVLQQAQTLTTAGMALGGATTIAVQPFTSNGWGVGTTIAQTPGLANIWGAVGTGSTAPALGNTALQAEIGRAILSSAAVFASQVILDFFMGLTVGNGVITEAGIVLNGGLTQPTLTSALAIGQQYGSLSVTALADAIPSGRRLSSATAAGRRRR